MAGLYTSKRAIFPRRKQKEFLLNTKRILNLSYIELAKLLKISRRTLTDWKREKFSMTLRTVKILIRKTNRKMPKDMEIKDPFWYVNKAAKLGGAAVYKKYGRIGGDPEIRKQRWYEWWEREGRFKHHPIINAPISIKKPRKSKDLAEFIGIMLGDGGMTKGQLTITLNRVDDKKYINFVSKLIKRLFGVTPSIYHSSKALINDIVVSRVELVRFCVSLGLLIGSKVRQQIDIPEWIKQNNSFLISCTRGLIDTDGCIFIHSYKVNNTIYSYKKLAFSNRSKPLLVSVYRFLKGIGLFPRFTNDGKDVRIESKNGVQKYFRVINSHNPKHLMKYFK